MGEGEGRKRREERGGEEGGEGGGEGKTRGNRKLEWRGKFTNLLNIHRV